MTDTQNYDLWIGSELGILKGCQLLTDSFVNYGNIKTLDKSLGITTLNWQEKENNIHVGLKNGTVKTFDAITHEYGSCITCDENSAVRGIVAMPNKSLIICSEKGKLKYFKGDQLVTEKSFGDDIKAMAGSSTAGTFATGGHENDLKVWQIDNMEKPVFSAKNVRNDFLDLRVPVWVSAIEFLKNDSRKVAVATGHHSVRIYDRREKRRPVLDVDWLDHPLTAISVTSNNNSVIVGNTAGFMGELDLRTGKQVGGFKGNAGSIRSIKCHDSQSYVVACGLDRFLKVYDIKSRELLKKIYMKSNLNCVALSKQDLVLTRSETGTKRELSKDTEDCNEIWGKMEKVSDKNDGLKKSAKRKKK